jgi:hypothetical protein
MTRKVAPTEGDLRWRPARGEGRWLTPHQAKFDRDGNRRTAYSLRHTYICMRLMEGADIYQIAKNCRTSVEMIEKFYAALIKNTLDAAAINVWRARPSRGGRRNRRNRMTVLIQERGPMVPWLDSRDVQRLVMRAARRARWGPPIHCRRASLSRCGPHLCTLRTKRRAARPTLPESHGADIGVFVLRESYEGARGRAGAGGKADARRGALRVP